MKLYIDTTNTDRVRIGLDGEIIEKDSKVGKSQMLLPLLEELLVNKGKSIEDIDSIEVKTGPGSFTGIRVGISVAQTLGWKLGIPVNGKNVQKGDKIEANY